MARGIADVPVMTSTTGGAPVIPPPEDGATAQGNMFSAPSPDAFTIPGQSKSQQLQMGPAQYAWQPGQEGFGQGDVQRYGFDTGMVPVAEMKLPFGALASRGQALAERKQQNQQAQKALIEKFDPYGGVGKAADPFQPAFGKYARGQIDKLAADIAAAYGGDIGEAYRRMATPGTKEYMLLKNLSQELQDIATENRFVYGQFADMLALDIARERTLDPDIKEDIIRFLSALDENGVPVEGVDPSEFRTKRRDLEARISMEQFMKDFMDKLPSIVQAQTQEFARAKSVGGGRYGLEEVTIKDFEPAIDFYAKQYSDASMGKVSVEQAKAQMRQVFNDEIKRSMATWSPRADSGGSSGSGEAGKGFRYTASTSKLPESLLSSIGAEIDPLWAGKNAPAFARVDYPTVNLFDIVSERGQTPYAREFIRTGGDPVFMHPTRIVDVNGKPFIIGKQTGMTKERSVGSGSSSGSLNIDAIDLGTDMTEEERIQEFTKLPDVAIPYNEANAAIIEGSFGLTPQKAAEMFASAPRSKAAQAQKAAEPAEADIKKAFPGAIKDPKHGWVAKDPVTGKWRKVNL